MARTTRSLAQINRKIELALRAGRSMKFSAAEMDMLTAAGLYDLLSAAEARELKEIAQQRMNSGAEGAE